MLFRLQLVLHFTSFNLENNYDYAYVYDGPDTNAPEIAALSGSDVPEDIYGTGSSLTVRFDSDGSVNYAGFEATVTSQGTAKWDMKIICKLL